MGSGLQAASSGEWGGAESICRGAWGVGDIHRRVARNAACGGVAGVQEGLAGSGGLTGSMGEVWWGQRLFLVTQAKLHSTPSCSSLHWDLFA